jgi:amidase
MIENLDELTIEGFHTAYRNGLYTSEDLVEAYLRRIQEIDKDESGPKLNSLLAMNHKALAEAKNLDALFKSTGQFVGSLHGVPVVIKDTVQTKGITTTFGSPIARDFVPEQDATVITKLKTAGAVILAKSALPGK